MNRPLSILLISLCLQSCCWFQDCTEPGPPPEKELPQFADIPQAVSLNTGHLAEISGIAPSYRFTDHLWVLEDSGNEAALHLLRNDGTVIRKVSFAGANRDWEDLATGPGPQTGVNYLYIGEIGDNNATYGDYYVYRFGEPTDGQTGIDSYDTIHFRYPGHTSYDAETLLVDPASLDIYIITKNQLNVRVYRLPYPQDTAGINVAEFMGTIRYFLIVSGDVSPDGSEVLLKTYNALYYWKRETGENLYQVLSRNHDLTAPYTLEPQGEAVCWDTRAAGYYTLSEKGSNPEMPPLYYYPKINK